LAARAQQAVGQHLRRRRLQAELPLRLVDRRHEIVFLVGHGDHVRPYNNTAASTRG
jgi:hypothetical protein